MNSNIHLYNQHQTESDNQICDLLAQIIDNELIEAESKIWHTHPVWFINNNPIVGYSKQKKGIRLMFWSGADFNEDNLNIKGQKFKDASIFFNKIDEVNTAELIGWLKKSREIQ
jgi:uncharacterized protein YdhG (YjbR/CyaY superfamily)